MDYGICVLVRMYEASGLFIPSKNSDCAYLKIIIIIIMIIVKPV